MKTKLLRRLRRQARRNIEVTISDYLPENGYYFFNKGVCRAYAPNKKYDRWPWKRDSRLKYCKTTEEVKEEYKYVLWSETVRLFENYKVKIMAREKRENLKKIIKELK